MPKHFKTKFSDSPQKRPEPDCCTLQILGHGESETVITAIGNSVDLDYNLNAHVGVDEKVKATALASAEASAIASAPPASSADSDTASDSDAASKSDGDSKAGLKEKKGKDLIAKADKYRVRWNAVNSHGPVIVRVRIAGQVEGSFSCADKDGLLTLSNLKILESDKPLNKADVRVVLDAVDACGGRAHCEFNIREP